MASSLSQCFNPTCPATRGGKLYTAKGLASHLAMSIECRSHVSLANADFAHERRQHHASVLGYLDVATATTGVIIAPGAGTNKRRHQVLVNDAYPLPAVTEQPVPNGVTTTAFPAPIVAEAISDVDNHDFAFHDDDMDDKAPTVSCTVSERCMVQLLKLLDDMGSPDYAVAAIIDWACQAHEAGFDFRPKQKTRAANLSVIYNALHNSTKLLPSIVPVQLLEVSEPVDVIVFDWAAQMLSLFHNSKMMTSSKLNLDPANPGARYESPDNVLGEMHSGSVYNQLYDRLVVPYAHDGRVRLLAPQIHYWDKTHISNGSPRFGLEPGTFTTSLFTEEARRSVDAWRMLGFVHQVHKSAAENSHQQADTNVTNYHRQLKVLYQGLADVQQGIDDRLMDATVTIDGHTFVCDIISPIICVIADSPAANICCGHYNAPGARISRPHRACDIGFDDLDNPDRRCTFVKAETQFALMRTATKATLKQHSLKRVADHAYSSLIVGDPERNIFGATPTDVMHSIRLCMLKRANTLLFECLSTEGKKRLDTASRQFHRQHRQSERSKFPRSHFVDGLSALAKLSADEQTGVVLALCCMLQQADVWDLFDDALRPIHLAVADVLNLLECLICFDAWTRQPTFWARGDVMAARRAEDAISTMIEQITTRLPRDKGNGWKVPTLHTVKHLVREIEAFGALRGFMADSPEHHHIEHAKRPGRAAQKNFETFERQAATRISNSIMIRRAHELFCPGEVGCSLMPNDDDADTGWRASPCATKFTVYVPEETGVAPLIEWHTKTNAAYLDLPTGLATFAIEHYKPSKQLVMVTELKSPLQDVGTVRCHPGYRTGDPWYDWVEVMSDDGVLIRPFKVLAVVPLLANDNTDTHEIRYELIGCMCNDQTERDSVLFTEWNFNPAFCVVKTDRIVRRSFVVKVSPKIVSVVTPVELWAAKFAS